MKKLLIRLSLIGFIAVSLYACGNKGDLYIPEKKPDKTQQND